MGCPEGRAEVSLWVVMQRRKRCPDAAEGGRFSARKTHLATRLRARDSHTLRIGASAVRATMHACARSFHARPRRGSSPHAPVCLVLDSARQGARVCVIPVSVLGTNQPEGDACAPHERISPSARARAMGLDIYQAVTDRIIELLDRGTAPWRHPIRGGGGAGGREGSGSFPANLASGKNYRGINVFLLAITAWIEGYDSPYWLTFRQARERGGSVRKGEKGSLVIFWKQCATKDAATGDEVTIPVLRHYTVFNAEQCEGIAAPGVPEPDPAAPPFEQIEAAARIVERYTQEGGGPRIQHRGRRASYWPREDFVQIAEPEWFVDPESYYATMFHELAHSTGHSSRLDRGLEAAPPSFGSPDYSKEELVAEMGAAFLAAASGISPPTIEQSAAYIAGWRKKLGSDRKLVIQAAGAGQRAADWILGNRASEPG